MVTSSLKDQLQQPLIGFIVTLSFTFASHRSTRLVSLRDVDFIVTMSPCCRDVPDNGYGKQNNKKLR